MSVFLTQLSRKYRFVQGSHYINAHATGTELNDRVESELIQKLFPHRPWVAASKSILGHAIGASGALEAIITALSIRHQRSPMCLNLQNPAFDLNFVLDSQKHLTIQHALSCSYAFGGHNVGLVLSAI